MEYFRWYIKSSDPVGIKKIMCPHKLKVKALFINTTWERLWIEIPPSAWVSLMNLVKSYKWNILISIIITQMSLSPGHKQMKKKNIIKYKDR